jgi:hypothetical protein
MSTAETQLPDVWPAGAEDAPRLRPGATFERTGEWLRLRSERDKHGRQLLLLVCLDESGLPRWGRVLEGSTPAPEALSPIDRRAASALLKQVPKLKARGASPVEREIVARTEELRTKRRDPTHRIPVPDLQVNPLDSEEICSYVETFRNPQVADFRREVIDDFNLRTNAEISQHTSVRQREYKRTKGFFPELADFRIWARQLKQWHDDLTRVERALARRSMEA